MPDMIMKSGESWHCTNPSCLCQVRVEVTGEIEGQNPRCACGSLLKKVYTAPVFRYLDFLRFGEPVFTRRDSSEE
jgi:hypothetical protein